MAPLSKEAQADVLLRTTEARAKERYERATAEVLNWPEHIACFSTLEVGIYRVSVGYNDHPEYVALHGGALTYSYHDLGHLTADSDRDAAVAFIRAHLGDHADVDFPGLSVVGARR